jgi:hypothetical protein
MADHVKNPELEVLRASRRNVKLTLASTRSAAEPSAALTGWQSLFMTVMYSE